MSRYKIRKGEYINICKYGFTDNANYIWIGGLGGGREKGRNLMVKKENGKGAESFLRSILTLHTAACTARTKRNDFPAGLSPQPPLC